MKTRITLILLMAFALCSCLGESNDSKLEEFPEQGTQDPTWIMMDMHITGKLSLDKGGYQMEPLTKGYLDERSYDEQSYNAAKRLLKTYNKDIKDLLSKLEKRLHSKDYKLYDATLQLEFAKEKKYSDYNSSNNRRLITDKTSPVDTSYIVADGVKWITAICFEHEPGSTNEYYNDSTNDRLHILVAEIAGETSVYCRRGVGTIFIPLPESNIPIKLTYLTSFPYGGFCEW